MVTFSRALSRSLLDGREAISQVNEQRDLKHTRVDSLPVASVSYKKQESINDRFIELNERREMERNAQLELSPLNVCVKYGIGEMSLRVNLGIILAYIEEQ